MKTKFKKKLRLNKKTVSNLNNYGLDSIRGGFSEGTDCGFCNTEGIACRPTTQCPPGNTDTLCSDDCTHYPCNFTYTCVTC
ncbi:MAG: class I lanthipeptide [Candidatus Aminicenantes bacterium]|nr:MAG: class I lanthipeptide [Candidatus Aminicenantes bacterium]